MKEKQAFLEHYSSDAHYAICERYLECGIAWSECFAEIECNGVAYFDVSNVLQLYPHLELDENYRLICYLGREYHGIWGRIAAIRNDDDTKPVINPRKTLVGKEFELPEGTTPPMEAIYHDETDEGLLEAVLCSLFLQEIPYVYYENPSRARLMSVPPRDFAKKWNTFVDIENWIPRRVGDSIIAFKRESENGLGSSDGKDRIYLTQFDFERNLGFYHAFKAKNSYSMYKNQINDDKRYNEKRRCCVFVESSVLVAREI